MNRRLLLLNGLAILGVVANHASHSGFIAMFWWTDRYRAVSVPNFDQMGSLSYYGLVAAQKLALFSVPSFLFVSGVFIAYMLRGDQPKLSWTVIRRRVVNLIPPYLIWLGVYLLGQALLENIYTPSVYLEIALGLEFSPFFYVPLIIVMYLISPLLAPLAVKRPKTLLVIGAVILLGGILRKYLGIWDVFVPSGSGWVAYLLTILPRGVYLEFIFYYLFGMVVGLHYQVVKEKLAHLRWLLLAAVVTFGALALAEAEWMFRLTDDTIWRSITLTLPTAGYAVSFILCYLAFAEVRLPFEKMLYQLGTVTLGIYLMHSTVILFLPKIIYHVLPAILAYQVIYQTLLVSAAVAGSCLVMAFVRRTRLRRTYRYLFG